MRRLGLALASAALLASTSASSVGTHPHDGPRLTLWAWERPEDLRFIDAKTTGVAFLASTVRLQGGAVVVRPRAQSLLVDPEVRLTAVVRIEANAADLSEDQRRAAVAELMRCTRLPHVDTLQIDFDARRSQRAFYRALLDDVRAARPRQRLSITALASWCLDDPWIADLPIDEAVPMLFRMGEDAAAIRAHVRGGGDFRVELCRTSAGVSTDEPELPRHAGRLRYVFNPRAWSAADFSRVGVSR
jgi:hypothetical protein